ncbi:hypothetical protein EST38_g11038 [Candolleomyces aberdarensis]|uniref:Uncharacterized protein n=1 Tax=Candolleomyces aberdarensis TaxID=2316362 RepID=A0A4Q2D7F8_9AGAR|nr:hypothetical protein EST38_g11038 [Candolleomyces aberdarensis]
MKPEARNALPERWLPKLCSQLSRAQSVEVVQAILDRLDGSLSDNQVESVLRQLLDSTEHKQLLELVLAYGGWSQRLSAWLLKSFPKHSVDEFHTFIHSEILERLSHFLLLLPCAFEQETQLFLSEARFQVERIPDILKYMVDFARGKTEVVVGAKGADSRGSVTGKKQKRAHQKQAHKMEQQNSGLMQQDLARFKVTDPQTKEEAFSNVSSLLDTLRGIFSRCLDVLQEPGIYLAIQSISVALVSTDTASHEEKTQQPANGSALEAPADLTLAEYPCIQPITEAPYFERGSEFGVWRILISSRTNFELRAARGSDAKFFKTIMKKILELSNGHFSGDNQRRLNRPDVGFPVFEAKITRDQRLVYQIDCVPEYKDNVRLLHFSTKDCPDILFYLLSEYLRGKPYCDRCIFRNQPYHKGDNLILPATFPPRENEASDDNSIPELPNIEDLEELHSMLVLEKFVTLSKELLKT